MSCHQNKQIADTAFHAVIPLDAWPRPLPTFRLAGRR